MQAEKTAPPENATLKERIAWLEKVLKFKPPLPAEKKGDTSEKPSTAKATGEKPKPPPKSEVPAQEVVFHVAGGLSKPPPKSEVPAQESEEAKKSGEAAYRQLVRKETDAAAEVVSGLEVAAKKAAACLPANDTTAATLQADLLALSTARKATAFSADEPDLAKFNFAAEQVGKLTSKAQASGEAAQKAVQKEGERRDATRKALNEHAAQQSIKDYGTATGPALPRLEDGAERSKKFEELLKAVGEIEKNKDYTGNEAAYTTFESLATQLKAKLDESGTAFTETAEALRVEAEKRAKKADELKKAAQSRQTKATDYARDIRAKIDPSKQNEAKSLEVLAKSAESGGAALKAVVDFAPAELPHAEYLAAVRDHEDRLKTFDEKVEKKIDTFFKMQTISTGTNAAYAKKKQELGEFFKNGIVQIDAAKKKMGEEFGGGQYDDALKSADGWSKLVAEAPGVIDDYKEAVRSCENTLKQIDKVITGPKVALEKKKTELKADVDNDLANAKKTLTEFGSLVSGINYLSRAYKDYFGDKDVDGLMGSTDEKAKGPVRDKVKAAVTASSLDFDKLCADVREAKAEAIEANKVRKNFLNLRQEREKEIDSDPVLQNHSEVLEKVKKTCGEISGSDLGFAEATRQLNAFPALVSTITAELVKLEKITKSGEANCKDVLSEFSHKLVTELSTARKEIAKRANNSSSTAGEAALVALEKTYADIAAFAVLRGELESVHHYKNTQAKAFPPDQGAKLAKLYKEFEDAGTGLKFDAAKGLAEMLAAQLEVVAKSSADLRRAARLCKEAPEEKSGELKKLYEEGVKQVNSGKEWSATGLEETLKHCTALFPSLSEAAARKMNVDMAKDYAVGVKQAGDLAKYDPTFKSVLEAAWKTAEGLVGGGKFEAAIAAFDKVAAQLETIGHRHVTLPFLIAWDEYQAEWQRVNIPAGDMRNQVAALASDIKVQTRGEVVEASVINKAKVAIDKLKAKLDDHAMFETAYPNVFNNYGAVLAQKPHSKQVKALEDLHKAVLDARENDPAAARVKLGALTNKINNVTNKMANFKAAIVPRPVLAGGSGFDTAADESTAKNTAIGLVEDGGITLANVATMVPTGTANTFGASAKYPTGFKYTWNTASGVALEIYGHGPTVNARVSADSDNKKGNVLRVKINDKYLRPNGDLTARATDATSHMSLF